MDNRIVGIDASNLLQGGGRTHLVELLRAVNPEENGFSLVVVWGSKATLALLDERSWLKKVNPSALEGGLLSRIFWQRFRLSDAARKEKCHVLLVPGGSYAGDFSPVVTMSRNMLPFKWRELRRYGCTLTMLKLLLLRWVQRRSFRRSMGVIFLTHYARKAVEEVTGILEGSVAVVPHGLNTRFSQSPREQRTISTYERNRPYRVLYVSIVDQYKHQWQVIDAIGRLRKRTGWPIQLDLVGPAYPPALRRLKTTIAQWDSKHEWVHYHGVIPYDQLHEVYQSAGLGLFASSCENMPNILVETMAAGLPIACSSHGAMLEVLGDAGVYFDPENSEEIAEALEYLILNPRLRWEKAVQGFELVQQYSWERCATETFSFLSQMAKEHEAIKS